MKKIEKNKHKEKTNKTRKFAMLFWHLFQGIFLGIFGVVLIILVLFGIYSFLYKAITPDPQIFLQPILPESSKIYSRDGQLLYEIYKEYKRTPVVLSDISPFLQKAIIAAEDKEFYTHIGVSFTAIVRAAFLDTVAENYSFGGSTITQQLIKVYVLNKEKTIARKISEAVWALTLEQHFSKDKILELYLNCVPFGRNTYGAEAAAQSYFGKSAKNLSLAEGAYLSALPNAPSALSPDRTDRSELEARKNKILAQMLQLQFINQEEYRNALAEKVSFLPVAENIIAPHFVFYIKQLLEQKYGEEAVNEGGLKIVTSLNLQTQKIAEEVVAKGTEINEKKYKAYNAALVAIDPKTGQILAMVGSKDYFKTQEPKNCKTAVNCLFEPNTNVATALRQPGSSFKPYLYATAFEQKSALFPGSIILDVTKNFSAPGFPSYVPHNYDGSQHGKVSLRKALAGSLNVAAVRLMSQVGVSEVVKTAQSLGLKEDFSRCGLSLALGSCEISLLEHTGGIAGLANNGKFNEVTGMLSVIDKYNKTLENFKDHSQQVINEQAAYEVISIMKDAKAREYVFGKNPSLTLPDREVIAKTGTTQNWKDGWTLGSTPSLTAGVWVGNNNGSLMASGADGVYVAAPIWHNFMLQMSALYLPENFKVPAKITEIKINPYTGKLSRDGEKQVSEICADYAMPQMPALSTSTPEETELPEIDYFPAKIITPTEGQFVGFADLAVKVEADGRDGTRTSLFLDDALISNLGGPIFNFTIPQYLLTPGRHIIKILAVNQGGYRSEDSVAIVVRN